MVENDQKKEDDANEVAEHGELDVRDHDDAVKISSEKIYKKIRKVNKIE